MLGTTTRGERALMAWWWVNQGQSYDEERDAGLLWAPKRGRNGARRAHWDAMEDLAEGDVVIHYARQYIRAVSIVTRTAVDARRPPSLPDDLWDAEGRAVLAQYTELQSPIHREEIPRSIRAAASPGPFQIDGGVKLGYLFPLPGPFVEWYERDHERPGIPTARLTWPELNESTQDYLRRLIGVELRTASGRANVIASVGDDNVMVITERSPEGKPVPISQVDAALTTLRVDGTVTISSDEIGHRSAFVGAVLLTVPGARLVSTAPPVVSIAAIRTEFDGSADGQNDGLDASQTFEGDLWRPRTVHERREQRRLRATLFGASSVAQCGVCQRTLPVRFLWAAHIKKRSLCSDAERRDLAHIAMPACLFGCDALFEMGFVAIDGNGLVVAAAPLPAGINDFVQPLVGSRTYAHVPASAGYFKWHFDNIYRGAELGRGVTLTPR